MISSSNCMWIVARVVLCGMSSLIWERHRRLTRPHTGAAVPSLARSPEYLDPPDHEPAVSAHTPSAPTRPWPSRRRPSAIEGSKPHRVRRRRAARCGLSNNRDKDRSSARSRDRGAPAGTHASRHGIGAPSPKRGSTRPLRRGSRSARRRRSVEETVWRTRGHWLTIPSWGDEPSTIR